MQRQDKASAATSELSGVRMPIVLLMQKYIAFGCLVLPMQRQKYNWKRSVKYFILCIRFSQILWF